MREIKFKGFHPCEKGTTIIYLDGKEIKGEWVEGDLYHHHEDTVISTLGVITNYKVIPETVRQFTGLKDKNGKEIYEGDIVLTQEYQNRPYSKKAKTKRHKGIVKYAVLGGTGFYNPKTEKWDLHMDYGAEYKVETLDAEAYSKYGCGSWGDFFDCEVIGNIYENKNLLEETK